MHDSEVAGVDDHTDRGAIQGLRDVEKKWVLRET